MDEGVLIIEDYDSLIMDEVIVVDDYDSTIMDEDIVARAALHDLAILSDTTVRIRTAEELVAISSGQQSAGRHYILENDIYLTHEWTPIPDFRGVFDGQGHTINNLFVLKSSNHNNAGLFGETTGATVKNVNIHIGTQGITAFNSIDVGFLRSANSGGLIGTAMRTNIMNVHINGNVSAYNTSTGPLQRARAGGVVGQIHNSYPNYVFEGNSAISNVSASGFRGAIAGGLIGTLSGSSVVSNSFSSGNIFVISSSPGWQHESAGGGLIGNDTSAGMGTIKNSYSTSNVSGHAPGTANVHIGGLLGRDSVSILSSFRLFTQSIVAGSDNTVILNHSGMRISYDQMRNQATFVGWDFDNVWEFRAGENDGFPVLRGQGGTTSPTEPIPPPRVSSIHTAEELAAIASGRQSADRHYILENDIYLTYEWTPIPDFRGVFDGRGHTINNLFVLKSSNHDNAGLFAETTDATVKNVNIHIGTQGITTFNSIEIGFLHSANSGGLIGFATNTNIMNVHINGNVSAYNTSTGTLQRARAGGVVGSLQGTQHEFEGNSAISNVSASGFRGAIAGGLIGTLSSSTVVSNSFSSGNIFVISSSPGWQHESAGGGLIGNETSAGTGTIRNSYSTSNVSGHAPGTANVHIGGLLGRGSASILSSFRLSTQRIEEGSDNTVILNHSGSPISSEQMRDQASFVGWDFDNVWEFRVGENDGFPVLRGQGGTAPPLPLEPRISIIRSSSSIEPIPGPIEPINGIYEIFFTIISETETTELVTISLEMPDNFVFVNGYTSSRTFDGLDEEEKVISWKFRGTSLTSFSNSGIYNFSVMVSAGTHDFSWNSPVPISGKDVWSFTNHEDQFDSYETSPELEAFLRDRTSNTEFTRTTNWRRYRRGIREHLNREWDGSCVGMGLTVCLMWDNRLTPNNWDPQASTLSEVRLDFGRPLINFYQALQVTDKYYSLIDQTLSRSAQRNIIEIDALMRNAELLNYIVYLDFNVSGIYNRNYTGLSGRTHRRGDAFRRAHAIVLHGSPEPVLNDSVYQYRVRTYDPNFLFENTYFYYNTDTGSFAIPEWTQRPHIDYNMTSIRVFLSSFYGIPVLFDSFNPQSAGIQPMRGLVTSDSTLPVPLITSNRSSELTIVASDSGTIQIDGLLSSGDFEANPFFNSGVIDTSGNVAGVNVFMPISSSYIVYDDSGDDYLDISISTSDYFFNAICSNGIRVTFAPGGSAMLEMNSGEFYLAQVFNEGYYNIPWHTIAASGENANTASLERIGDDIMLTSDNMQNIVVTGESDTETILLTFSTNEERVLLKAVDNALVAYIDANGDGNFDTPIATSDPTDPTDPVDPTDPISPTPPVAPTDPDDPTAPRFPSRPPFRPNFGVPPAQPPPTPTPTPTPPPSEDEVSVAEALFRLGLFVGTGTDADGNPIFEPNRPPTRLEALALVIRLMGLQNEAMAFTGASRFNDVPAWGDRYAAFGYSIGITVGVNEEHTLFAPNRQVTAHEFTTFLLRVLGYSEADGDFIFEEAMQKASSIGFFSPFGITRISTDNFLRDHAAHAMANALLTPPQGSNEYLLYRLANQSVFSREDADWFHENVR